MDTLFRLVSFQSDQSFNSTTRTSSSSRSSTLNNNNNNNNFNSHYHYYHHQPEGEGQEEEEEEEVEEECCNNNFYMDEDDFSSSSSRHFFPYHQQQQQHPHPITSTTTPTTTTTTASSSHAATALEPSSAAEFGFSPAPDLNLQGFASDKWATNLLMETARAIADKNSGRVQQLMWMLNELSSPYGDTDQKLASYFLQALFCRMTDSGERCYRTLTSASDKTCSFDSTRKMVLKFQEVSPWTTFGHVACNGAILEALEGESKLHIVDISNTYCTQWPTLLEALATRTDETPHLRLTTVVANKAAAASASASASGGAASSSSSSSAASAQKVMKEIGNRMEKFARLMGVPFKFNTVHHSGDLSDMDLVAQLDLRDDEALAINCVGSLHTVAAVENRRDSVLALFLRLRPKIVTVVEEEAELDSVGFGMEEEGGGFDFFRGFQECVRWFRVYLESLDESFPRTSNERLMLERAAGRALVDLLACPQSQSSETRESASRWSRRLTEAGFNPVPFSDDVSDDVRALLRRYREGCWSMTTTTVTSSTTTNTPTSSDAGIFLAWKDQPVVWASAWRPFS